MERPDKWLLLKITQPNNVVLLKIFGSWSGSYLSGSSWRLNSGVKTAEKQGENYLFKGYSGSQYLCNEGMYGATAFASGVLSKLIERTESRIEVVDEDKVEETLKQVLG